MKARAANKIRNKTQLMTELHRYINGEAYHDFKLIALAFAYLIKELVPDDRTTRKVFEGVPKE